jgi:hypothetical protein
MVSTFQSDLDPLDLEILERAFDGVCAVVKESGHLSSDEALEATLRRELIEIARLNGASDAETLRDIFLAALDK